MEEIVGLPSMEDHQYNNVLSHTQNMIWEKDQFSLIGMGWFIYKERGACSLRSLEGNISGNGRCSGRNI